jgi:hypothetical protein
MPTFCPSSASPSSASVPSGSRRARLAPMSKQSIRCVCLYVGFGALVLSLCACGGPEKADWKHAATANTIASYSDFLAKYPQGRLAEQARTTLEHMEWLEAKQRRSVQDLRTFLAKYPKGQNSSSAAAMLEDLEWAGTAKVETVKAYEDFLGKYPNGRFAEEARGRLEKARFAPSRQIIVDAITAAIKCCYAGGVGRGWSVGVGIKSVAPYDTKTRVLRVNASAFMSDGHSFYGLHEDQYRLTTDGHGIWKATIVY